MKRRDSERAGQLAPRECCSRSDLYRAALPESVARRDPDEVTAAIDAAIEALGDATDADSFVRRAGARLLEAAEW